MMYRKLVLSLILAGSATNAYSFEWFNNMCNKWWAGISLDKRTKETEVATAADLFKTGSGFFNILYDKILDWRKNKSDTYIKVDRPQTLSGLNNIAKRIARDLEKKSGLKAHIKSPKTLKIKKEGAENPNDYKFWHNGRIVPSDDPITKKVTIESGKFRAIIVAHLNQCESRRERIEKQRKEDEKNSK